jgi:hypothetical protein
MTKLFTIAGTSTLNGANTFRFATGKLNVRTAKLKRHGHMDVSLQELPEPMTKEAAVAFLTAQGVSDAVVPAARGKSKALEEMLTPEQVAEAKVAAKRAADAARKREKRANEKAARLAALDANFIAALTGDEQVEVPTVSDEEPDTDAGAAELLSELDNVELVNN